MNREFGVFRNIGGVNRSQFRIGLGHNEPMGATVTTVLIVDDHPAFRSSARRLLESEGYDVVGEAGDYPSAIALCQELRPDAVLLDVQLPGIDGFEVAERINQHCGDRPAPRIVLTSSRDASDFGALIAASPVRGFIAKNDLSGERLAELLQ